MAMASVISGYFALGNLKGSYGTYTDDGSTGGDISTGLHKVYSMMLTPSGNAVETNAPSINETFPVAGSAVTIVVDSASTGYWIAFGV